MTLLLAMLPFYVLGNFHCIGMCGPLVMMIGHHPYRSLYFFGRGLSFALAGMISGALGAVFNILLNYYHLPGIASLLCGISILFISGYTLIGKQVPGQHWLAQKLSGTNKWISQLLLRNEALPTFLFGFLTVLLPCGQTLVVFSACALIGDPFIGFLNGAVFALLTSPSLWIAMHARTLIHRIAPRHHLILGCCALLIGTLAICRGLADFDIIPHWILNRNAPSAYHIIIY